jgi:hypothetical protein
MGAPDNEPMLWNNGGQLRESPKRVGYVAVAIFVFILVTAVFENKGESTTSTDPVTVPATSGSGLLSYDGSTVEEMAFDYTTQDVVDAQCSLVDSLGYSTVRQAYLDAEPQLGTDAYEGAVFDMVLTRC